MNERVEGVYQSVEEALRAIEQLRDRGYSRDDITVVTNKENRDNFPGSVDANVDARDTDSDDSDRSLWDSIKNAFTTDDSYDDSRYDDPSYDKDNDPLYKYRDDINQGNVVVLVRENADAEGATTKNIIDPERTTPETKTVDSAPDTPATHLNTTDRMNNSQDDSIKLREEKLNVEKEKKSGEVHVDKRVVEDTETIEVPVQKEEVVIERKPVSGKDSRNENITDDNDEIVIPVSEDKVNVEKETEVVEEVTVKKDTKQDTHKVTDTVSHEELDVEKKGDARVDDVRTDQDKDDGTPGKNRVTNDRTNLNREEDNMADDLLDNDRKV